ncbi:MAG: hypothetical protein AAFU38_11505, partial [Bacteroidota bacterium]
THLPKTDRAALAPLYPAQSTKPRADTRTSTNATAPGTGIEVIVGGVLGYAPGDVAVGAGSGLPVGALTGYLGRLVQR